MLLKLQTLMAPYNIFGKNMPKHTGIKKGVPLYSNLC